MTTTDWTLLSLHLAAMLVTAVALGQAARRIGIPAVVGEIAGGLVLGPTVLGRLVPEFHAWLFPPSGPIPSARTAIARVGMLFFIVTIGLDISVGEFRRIGRKALSVGTVGTLVPLMLGFVMCYVFPDVIGVTRKDLFATALFMGSILSLSANPVIARILMDMGLFKSEIGRTIMSATLVDDLVGWGLFAVILAEFAPQATGQGQGMAILGLVFLFVGGILLAGRFLLPPILDRVHRSMPQPSSLISCIVLLALLGAAGSEHLGLHSFLGAFVVGIALADVSRKYPRPFEVIGEFSYAVFTPIFFVSMAIGADFVEGFDPWLVALVTIVAFVGKICGVYLGGRLAGMDSRQSLAVGCGLNARGILGIVMAAAAYEAQLIDLRLFVACVLMCVVTTMAAGPALSLILGRRSVPAVAILFALLATPAFAADPNVLLPGAVLERFAEEPDIVTPVGAAFDARGRLVVIESHTHFRPEGYAGPARDRLRIVEDTDGDGRADRFRTFLDGLTFATGLRRGPGDWLIVVTRSGVERVRDGDGDDVAEIREPLVRLETTGTYPHNGLGGLAFDADGRLWFGLGENLGAEYRLVAADGSVCQGGGEGGSVFRCTADGRHLERVATGFWNPFGLCRDPAGRMFAVDNDPDSRPPCRLIDVVPTGDYGYQFRFGRGGRHPLQAWNGELPGTLPMAAGTGEAPCAVVVFDGALWVTSWGSNRLERFTLEPSGATVKSEGTIAVQGDHRFRPVDAAVAPDGSLFVTDWVDRSYPVHGAGRIWRLRIDRADGAATQRDWPPLSAEERRARDIADSPADGPPPSPQDLGSADPFIRQAAVAAMVARGGTALPALETCPHPLVRQSVVLARRWLSLRGDAAGTGAAAEATCRAAVADADDRVRLPAIRWIAESKLERLRPALEAVTGDPAASPQAVRAALAAIAWLGGSADLGNADSLAAIWGDDSRPETVRAAALAAMPAGASQAPPERLERLVRGGPPALAREAARHLAMRWGSGAKELASLAVDRTLPAERRADATAGLAKSPERNVDLLARLADDPDVAVAREAKRGGPVTASPTNPRPEAGDVDAWLPRLGAGGSPDAGWRAFFATSGGRCGACHMLGGRGGAVGPDLTGIVARMGRRRVLESLLHPDKEIGPGYVAYAIQQNDGRVVTGLPAGLVDGDTAERFLTTDGSAIVLPVAEIESRTPLATSLMPKGLEQVLSDDDLRDLLAVLTEEE